jgi:hypothetical protein
MFEAKKIKEENVMKLLYRRLVKQGLFYVCLLAVVGMVYNVAAVAQTEDQQESWLDQKLAEGGLAAVYFYKPEQDKGAQAFDRAHKSQRFADAGMHFLRVNVDKPQYKKVADEYNLEQLPTIMLFKDGEPDKVDGEVATLSGFTSVQEIKSFIEDNFSSDITAAIREIQQTEEPAVRNVTYRVVRERPRPRISFGIGAGYPYNDYWYGRPYGYGPYYSPYWGGGWGGYRGWGRGGWGGYGGGVGFGIGFGF